MNASIQVENQKATLAAVAHAYKAAKSIVCASLYRSGEARDFKTKRRAHAGQLNLGSNSS